MVSPARTAAVFTELRATMSIPAARAAAASLGSFAVTCAHLRAPFWARIPATVTLRCTSRAFQSLSLGIFAPL